MYGKVLLFLLLFILVIPVRAALFINEVQVEPDEAVEIVNEASESADLSGWIVDDSGGTTFYTIGNGIVIPANACIIINGSFNLNKATPDSARLLDKTASIAAILQYQKSPGANLSWQRVSDMGNDLIATASSLGLWNKTRQSCIQEIITSPTLAPLVTTISYPQVLISEVLSNPTEGNEWVELYNPSDSSISLENWYIDDEENAGSTPFMFSVDIPAKSYETINISKNIINNSGDIVRILTPQKNSSIEIRVVKLSEGKTYGRQSWDADGTWCITEATPGEVNATCVPQEEVITPSSIPTSALTTAIAPSPFPTINIASTSAILGVSSPDIPSEETLLPIIPYTLIRSLEAMSILSILTSFAALLCYTEFIHYATLTKAISSFIYTARKKRI